MSKIETEINLDQVGAIVDVCEEILGIELSEQAPLQEKKAGRSAPLGEASLKELYALKLINKSSYVQLAIAHDFGVLNNPKLSHLQTATFAAKWSMSENDINQSEMRKAIDKILTAMYRNDDGGKYPQLNLFD